MITFTADCSGWAPLLLLPPLGADPLEDGGDPELPGVEEEDGGLVGPVATEGF